MKAMMKAAILGAGLLGSAIVFAASGSALQEELQKMVNESAMPGGEEIQVAVEEGGKVLLSGMADDSMVVNDLVEKIKHVDGVSSVENLVTESNGKQSDF